MGYPDNYLKGIPNENDIVDQIYIASHVFDFRNIESRSDGFNETSINWLDDNGAIKEVLNKRKENGDYQFKAGYSKLATNTLRQTIRINNLEDFVGYERDPLENNKYHGNILAKTNMPKKMQRYFQGALAMGVKVIPRST